MKNKMKTLSDRDLGIDCDFVARADTEDEVIKLATDHIREEHPDMLEDVRNEMAINIKTE